MSDKRPSSTKLRRLCVDTHKYLCPLSQRHLMDCYLCGLPIDLVRDKPESWQAEHVIRWVLSKNNNPENIWPAHTECHKPKTAADIREHSKGKRVRDKHFGIEVKRKRQWKPAGAKYDWSSGRYKMPAEADE